MASGLSPSPDFERFRVAALGGWPDRPPLAEITIADSIKESFLDAPVQCIEDDIRFYVEAGYDYFILGRRLAGWPPLWDAARFDNYYEIQRQVGRGKSGGVIGSWEDFEAYPWQASEAVDYRILDLAERHLPREMKIVRYLGPVFQIAWILMGFENFCLSTILNPGLVEAVIDRVFQVVHRELEDALSRDAVGAVWYGDDIAIKGQLMVSPVFLKQVFFPRLGMLAGMCRSRNIPFLYHTDGEVTPVLDDIIEAGVHVLHPVDPTCMDIRAVKRAVGGRLALAGNVDVDLLIRGERDEVIAATRSCLEDLEPGGGYLLGSSNSIPRTVKIENYRAMLEVALNRC